MKRVLLILIILFNGCEKEDNSSLIEGYEAQIQNYLNQTKALQEQISNLSQSVSSLTAQVNSLENSNSDLSSQISSLENSNSELTSQVSSLQSANSNSTNEISELNETIAYLNSQLSLLQATNQDLLTNNNELISSNETLTSTINELNVQIQNLQQQINSLLDSTSTSTTEETSSTEETTTTEETSSTEETTTTEETLDFATLSTSLSAIQDQVNSVQVTLAQLSQGSDLTNILVTINSLKSQLETQKTNVNSASGISNQNLASLQASIASIEVDFDSIDAAVAVVSSVTINASTNTSYSTGSGSITLNGQSDTSSFSAGSTVTINAVPDSGSYFVGWTGDITGSQNPINISLNANKTITAIFQTSYSEVTVGSQTWMTEDLKTTHYSNGSLIPSVDISNLSAGEIDNLVDNTYLNSPVVYIKDGTYYYNGHAAKQSICPTGYTVPSGSQYQTLIDYGKTNYSDIEGYNEIEKSAYHIQNGGESGVNLVHKPEDNGNGEFISTSILPYSYYWTDNGRYFIHSTFPGDYPDIPTTQKSSIQVNTINNLPNREYRVRCIKN